MLIQRSDLVEDKNEKKIFAPTIQLLGHQGEVFTNKFSKCGNYLASAGFDREILIWDIFDKNAKNLCAFKGHKNTVLDLHWS